MNKSIIGAIATVVLLAASSANAAVIFDEQFAVPVSGGVVWSFAGQPDELATIRHSLRPLMLNSPLCRPRRMARELETVYRRMWHVWCRDLVDVTC